MSAVHEQIICALYAFIVDELDPDPLPIESYLTDPATQALAAEIVGDNNYQYPCDDPDCDEDGDHTPRDEHWCADHCPECNKEEAFR